MPTADQVARAIVAAARETGEDPEACIIGAPGLRCRHYAMHALSRAFPAVKHNKHIWAKLTGASSNPKYFWANSVSQKFNMAAGGPRAGKRAAKWWDEAAFERVIDAIGVEQPPAPRRAPVKLSADFGSIVEPTRPAATPGKRALHDMLRAAVENTARLPRE